MFQRKAMDVEKVLHMTGGVGETSYAINSAIQRLALPQIVPIIQEAIHDLCSTSETEKLAIADLGCSSGPTTLFVISEIINTFNCANRQLGRSPVEICAFLNDLPGNDFNTIFQSLHGFYEKLNKERGQDSGPCFIAAMPGSFYGRLFPKKSLHFLHSSFSLHWISQVPNGLEDENGVQLNKGNVYLSETSPPAIFEAYLKQFQRDFSLFLSSRSEELVSGGKMVLTLAGRRSEEPSNKEHYANWSLVADTLREMVSQGVIEEEKFDSFNLPFYAPSVKELKDVISAECSFEINRIETYGVSFELRKNGETAIDKDTMGSNMEKTVRAMLESMLAAHFGEAVIDDLFQRYRKIASEHWYNDQKKLLNLIVSMTKKE